MALRCDSPDRMQLVRQPACLRPFINKVFHPLSLLRRAALETAGVVENELLIAFEYQLILDVVLSALHSIERYKHVYGMDTVKKRNTSFEVVCRVLGVQPQKNKASN